MEFVPVLVAGFVAKKLIDFLAYLRVGNWSAAFTQFSVWLAGSLVAFLFRFSDFASAFHVGDTSLASLNAVSVLLVGLVIGSTASVVAHDVPKALDNSQSAAIPRLLP